MAWLCVLGPSRGEKFSGELRHAAPGRLSGKGLVNVEEAGDDAFHVGVHAGDVVAEGDARYGRGRIGADARQGAYGFRIGGKAAVKAFLQDGSGPDHGARPRIVAESLPGPGARPPQRLRRVWRYQETFSIHFR